MISPLASARAEREAAETARQAQQKRFARRVAWIRLAILLPLLAGSLALIWYIGFLQGSLS